MNWVSVAELLERQVPIHWAEAVAMIAELCGVLLDQGARGIPHASDVLINAEGKLSIRNQDFGETNSAALGRLLHSLFATGSTPAPLRLFVSQAISSDRYPSVSAFADALASYEVPERDKLIQGVYDRWVATRTGAAASVAIPLRQEAEQDKKQKSKADARRFPRWAIATVVAAVAAGGTAGAWLAVGAVPSIPPISLSSISASVPAAIQEAFAWIGVSEASRVAAAEPDTTTTKRAPGTKRKSSAAPVRTSNPDLDATAHGIGETLLSGSIAPSGTADVPDRVTSTTLIVTDASAPAVASEGSDSGAAPATFDDAVTVPDATVYSRAFPGVMPPVMVTRQIPSRESLTPGVEAISTIEVLVDESGEVAQVRLLSRPSPVLATMLLSAAKTWKFRPALNDGRPVKYRLRLDVTTTRP